MRFNDKNAIKKLARNLVNDMIHMNDITIPKGKGVNRYAKMTNKKK